MAELRHEAAPDRGAPRNVQARQRGTVHGDACHARLGDRRAAGEVQEVRVHAAEGSEGRVVDPLAATHVELGEVLEALGEGGQAVRVNLIFTIEEGDGTSCCSSFSYRENVSCWIGVCPLLLAYTSPIRQW